MDQWCTSCRGFAESALLNCNRGASGISMRHPNSPSGRTLAAIRVHQTQSYKSAKGSVLRLQRSPGHMLSLQHSASACGNQSGVRLPANPFNR
eukprot:1343097-Amphidinium_carterae.1